jgi:hypothetical protein
MMGSISTPIFAVRCAFLFLAVVVGVVVDSLSVAGNQAPAQQDVQSSPAPCTNELNRAIYEWASRPLMISFKGRQSYTFSQLGQRNTTSVTRINSVINLMRAAAQDCANFNAPAAAEKVQEAERALAEAQQR